MKRCPSTWALLTYSSHVVSRHGCVVVVNGGCCEKQIVHAHANSPCVTSLAARDRCHARKLHGERASQRAVTGFDAQWTVEIAAAAAAAASADASSLPQLRRSAPSGLECFPRPCRASGRQRGRSLASAHAHKCAQHAWISTTTACASSYVAHDQSRPAPACFLLCRGRGERRRLRCISLAAVRELRVVVEADHAKRHDARGQLKRVHACE